MGAIDKDKPLIDMRLSDEAFAKFFMDYWKSERFMKYAELIQKGDTVIGETFTIQDIISDTEYVDKVYAIYKTKEA